MRLQITAEKLGRLGVETLGIVGSGVERVRFFLRFRPVRGPLGADPDLSTHRAYGLPHSPVTPEIWGAIGSAYDNLARELGVQVAEGKAREIIGRLDGFEPAASEHAEFQRHQIQFTGQFLVDREGIVRWSNVEGAREGLAGMDKFPGDEELLAAAAALPR